MVLDFTEDNIFLICWQSLLIKKIIVLESVRNTVNGIDWPYYFPDINLCEFFFEQGLLHATPNIG